jgi:SulP family sulfate permease
LIVAPEKVVRGRISSDPAPNQIAIYDIEGDLLFGSAPDLHAFLDRAKDDALKANVQP